MALIIEDGTGVHNADTFISAEFARSYASARGVVLPESDAEVEVLLIKAKDWLEAQPWAGSRTSREQALDWPRESVTDPDWPDSLIPSNQVPEAIRRAQGQLVVEGTLLDLMPSSDGRAVKKEKVADLEVEYADPVSPAATPSFPSVLFLIGGLLDRNSIGSQLRILRG